jgi:transcriptional regulator with XRE-family HTH domain
MDFGSVLRSIRIESNWRLSDVSKSTGLDIDYLSKIERNERPQTSEIIKRLSDFYGVNFDNLIFLYHISIVNQYLSDVSKKIEVIDVLREIIKNPNYIPEIPKPKNVNKNNNIRTKSTKFGKVKGFNFYIQWNGKLKVREREEIIKRSEHYYSELQNKIGIHSQLRLVELDSTLTDDELVYQWNEFYENYGFHFDEFRKQTEKEKLKSSTKRFKNQIFKLNNPISGDSDDIDF